MAFFVINSIERVTKNKFNKLKAKKTGLTERNTRNKFIFKF